MLQLKEFPDIPSSTREEARESCPHPEEARFRLLARDDRYFPCLVGKEFPAFLTHLKRRRSRQERREEFQGRATIPRVPQMSQSIPEEPVFPALPLISAEDRLTPRWHEGQPCGTDSWESLMGKPRAKVTDPLIHAYGSVTLLLQLGRKAPEHALSRDEV